MAKKSTKTKNNSVQDAYSPPPIGTEFEPMMFEDIETDDLIWLSDASSDGMVNHAHKKLDEQSAMDVMTGQVRPINARMTVYQKT